MLSWAVLLARRAPSTLHPTPWLAEEAGRRVTSSRSFSADNSKTPQEAPSEGASYEDLKRVARSTGDAAKEWMEGSSTSGSSIYKQAKRTADDVLRSTRRGLEGVASHVPGETPFSAATRDARGKSGSEEAAAAKKSFGGEVGGDLAGTENKWEKGGTAENGTTGNDIAGKGYLFKAADALERGLTKAKGTIGAVVSSSGGAEGAEQVPRSARAVWQDSRSEEVKESEQGSRKAQLTDEAAGDNPAQAVAREERQVTPDAMYTKH